MPHSKKYDWIYRRYLTGPYGIPVEYARTLAHWESRQNAKNKKGNHWGLFQVNVLPKGTLDDYNKSHSVKYKPDEMTNPIANAKVFGWAMNRFLNAWAKTGIANLKRDWTNPEFVKLATAGWNSGAWSKRGVLKVARWLQERDIPVTHDNVFKHGKEAGGAWTLDINHPHGKAKHDWQVSVALDYARARNFPWMKGPLAEEKKTMKAEAEADAAMKPEAKKKGGTWIWLLLLAMVLGRSKR